MVWTGENFVTNNDEEDYAYKVHSKVMSPLNFRCA